MAVVLLIIVVPGPHVVTVEQTVDVIVLKVVAPDGVKTLSVAEQLGTADPEQEVSEAVEVGELDVGDGVLEGVALDSSVSSSSVSSVESSVVSSDLGFGGSEGGVGGGNPPPPPPPPPPLGHRSGTRQPGSHSGPTQAQATVGIGMTAPLPSVDE